ncbi:6-hydroxymethylpterin diphosphokinase MptE-like protein [Neobacillus sp. D3-1R]|uniref:6-hydroxymethylpterin diphosphokinase MptE-like protein n=1 Tax=Neobacillus sp. D3-1R TaxID=3445778 RepID=UPI003FA0A2D4
MSRKVKKLKGSHQGESCFIIGNGPSLTVEDLNMLKNQANFSCNRINLLLDKTDWMPYYYTFTDSLMASTFFDEVYKMEKKKMFVVVSNTSYNSLKKQLGKDCIFLRSYYEVENNGLPKFSDDVSKKIFQHGTVTFANIQLAAYMGFKNIYLLGVDHNFGISKQKDGSINYNKELIGRDHFDENYYKSVEHSKEAAVNVYAMTEAYLSAKDYCDKRGVKIFNATRGGKLEVFQRVNFDDLFDDNGELIREVKTLNSIEFENEGQQRKSINFS